MYSEAKSNKPVGLIHSFSGGGAERQMVFLLGHGIVEKAFVLEPGDDYNISSEKIISLAIGQKKLSRVIRFLMIPVFAYKLASQVEPGQVVISFSERSNLINVVAKVFKKHKTFVTVLTNPKKAYRGIKFPVAILARVLYHYADKIITNSFGAKYYIEKSYGVINEKIMTIHNPIDISITKVQANKTINPSHEFIFNPGQVAVIVGRFEKPKGHEYAFRAFKLVLEKIPDANLVLLGQGPLQLKLENLVETLGIRERVHFLGFQKNPFAYVARANMLILPSLWEGLPNVFLESLAVGTPVVAVDCDFGPREIFNLESRNAISCVTRHDCGIITPALVEGDSQKQEVLLAEGIVQMFQDTSAKERLNKSVNEILTQFSPVRHIAHWNKLLKEFSNYKS